MDANLIAIAAALAATGLAAIAEWLHARRCRELSRLVFGPAGGPRAWTRVVPALRTISCGCLAWGLTVLAMMEPQAHHDRSVDLATPSEGTETQRVVILLDVSPSMNIADSGPEKDKRRRDRILDVTDGILSRIALARTKFSVIAFFTSARPIVTDASDVAVVRNVMDNLPLVWSFEPGDTDVLSGLQAAADLARDWPPNSTTLLLCTDGDTTDFSRVPQLPRSFRQVDILAVGDPATGTLIHNHESRQQAGILRQLARELRGRYYDVNTRQMPTAALTELAYVPPPPPKLGLSLKELALLAILIGATLLTIIPLALEYAGSAWNAARQLPVPQATATENASEIAPVREVVA